VYQTTFLVLLVYAVLALPVAQSAIRASAELVPKELGEVARSLGKPPFRAFLLATLPNLMPGIGAALALVALQLMRELTATLLLAPAGIVTLATEFWNYTSDRAYGAAAPFAAVLVLVSGLPVYISTVRSLRLNADD
jgi:iron(III) transport system permease protein